MIRILFVHHAVGWGGAPNSMIKLIRGLDPAKYDCEVLLLKHSIVASKLHENNIKFSIAKSTFYKKYYKYFIHSEAGYVKWYQFYTFILLSISWLLSRHYFAKKELENKKFDIIHLNSSVLTDWLKPAKRKGKVIIHVREPFRKGKLDMVYSFFKCQINKYADQVIAISQDNADRIGLPQKTNIIYNFEDFSLGSPNLNSYNSKKVLYMGGDSSIKGYYTLINALDYINDDVTIYFCGSFSIKGEHNKIIKKIIKGIFRIGKKKKDAINKMRSHNNIVELGMISDVHKYLDEVCCLVSPFTVPHFSRPVIEGYFHSKPAIGTNVKGMDEIIIHGQNGLIVTKDSPVELAKAINELTSDGKKAKTFGENGLLVAHSKFSPKNILMVEKIYNDLKFNI
jgi:glycosyltransferase involved in cell wall biosynthesis